MAPAESTLAFYQVHLYWNGSDPDGQITFYEYSVTDSNKTPGEDTPDFAGYFATAATDSVFRMTADDPQTLGHRFYVRAVDNEGKVDPTPAWTYFVAQDFNFPDVVFHTQTGTWTDKFGTDHTIIVDSNGQFNPSDTIGVGGCVEFSWSGFDRDVGGSVVGYESRILGDAVFSGGTLADTTFSKCFPLGFSGREVLTVHAIDDAGASTFPDSIRSVVVNFNPICWIVDPLITDHPVRARVFQDAEGTVFPSGTILADGFRNIRFAYTGFDDARDYREDPENPGVQGFSFRRLVGGGGPAFREVAGGWEPFPAINTFSQSETQGLTSGDYLFIIRSLDDLNRWGTPDSVLVGVNYPPYFREVVYYDTGGVPRQLWNQAGGDTLAITLDSGGGSPPPLRVGILAVDEHSADAPDPLDISNVVEDEVGQVTEYRVRINGSTDGYQPAPAEGGLDRFLEVATVPDTTTVVRPGLNTLEVRARDDGGRVTELFVVFSVGFQP
jgi:hypothetical protein